MRSELVWEGKYDEFGRRREVDVAGLNMPLQRIETIDEPRSRAEAQGQLFDVHSAHRDNMRNLLIWGDNKPVLGSLVPEYRGKVALCYIDPPFDVGADFTMQLPIGDGEDVVGKDQSIIEMIAYRDMWGRGQNSYLQMLYERLVIAKELLSEDSTIYVHCDERVSHSVKLLLDDVFGRENFQNEVVWKRSLPHGNIDYKFGSSHDVIIRFTKTESFSWNPQYQPHREEYLEQFYRFEEPGSGRRYRLISCINPNKNRPNLRYEWRGVTRVWKYRRERMQQMHNDGLLVYSKNGIPQYKGYLDEMKGTPMQDIWTDISPVMGGATEKLDFPTQKPEALLERIIQASSEPDDIVLDFFCGSGTTLAVAEKLGRRWIGCDLGRFAVHTAQKRLIGIQRNLHGVATPYRSFDVYNLGRYERQWWQKEALRGADEEHRTVVLQFFRAEILNKAPSPLIHGRKGTAFVHVDGIDSVFTRDEVKAVAESVKASGGREVHCLAWDFEMDLRQVVAAVEVELGVKMRLHRIPREIMERNRTEMPPFFEVALLEAAPVYRKGPKGQRAVEIKLANFLPSLTEVPSKELEALQERAIESGFDFIDFWAVDFDWTPGQPFNHHWQDYRTRKDRSLKTVSDAEYVYDRPGKHTACVKVVDVFGCDTSITVGIEI
jgi:DNA modification methylase